MSESPMRVVTGRPLTPAPYRVRGRLSPAVGRGGKRPCRYIPLVTYKWVRVSPLHKLRDEAAQGIGNDYHPS